MEPLRVRSELRREFVVDCSVTLVWFFKDELNAFADNVLHEAASSTLVIPGLWALELTNALVVGERRRRCTREQSQTFLTNLSSLSFEIDRLSDSVAFSDTIHLARHHDLSAYDACYLELAIRRNIPLATLDKRMQSAAKEANVELFRP